jgi:CRISPR-associated protein Csd1
LLEHPLWKEVLEINPNLSFRLHGEKQLVCERPQVRRTIGDQSGEGGLRNGICLVTGEAELLERLHPAIKGVWGAQSSGANIVSFNLHAFCSFGKEQGINAPVGKTAAFAYTTALNHLLHRDSRQRIQVGDASTVFWAERQNPMENLLFDLFGESPKDDPDRGTRAVSGLYASPQSGAPPLENDSTRFYVLGLSPNASRISVRFWHIATVGELARTIRQHFEDISMEHPSWEPEYLSIFRILISTASLGKSENIPPNLAGDVMKSILNGQPYPRTLLQSVLSRIRAEQATKDKKGNVSYPRAAMIKAFINRQNRFFNSTEKEVTVSLDESNQNIGYRLGRLFAVLEKIQEEANPGINATIRDRFYGAASSTPASVFSTLLRLKNHHVAKLENRGRAINLEKLIGKIMDGIKDFAPVLNLEDQGRFAIGYYHQRQNFFNKPSEEKGE